MRELTVTADCGGSNGARVRLWKIELQKLADSSAAQPVLSLGRSADELARVERANALALRLAGVTAATAEVPGGAIVRDAYLAIPDYPPDPEYDATLERVEERMPFGRVAVAVVDGRPAGCSGPPCAERASGARGSRCPAALQVGDRFPATD